MASDNIPTTKSQTSSQSEVPTTDPYDTRPGSTILSQSASASLEWPAIAGFTILGELGRGGMGVVYRARQTVLNRDVALKTVLGKDQPEPRDLTRFLLEAEAVAAIRHPNVVQVYEFGNWEGRPFMALELLLGGTLSARLSVHKHLKSKEAAVLVGKIARGVAAAHAAGLVHRDLKPGNVIFDAAEEPKVTDFGLVKMGKKDLTQTGAMMGTPAYMAPEQGRDAKYVGPPSDVWALGVILYECLTGNRPFYGVDGWVLLHNVMECEPASMRASSPEISRDLELVCLRCLEKNPSDRYPSAAELAEDLEKFVSGEAVSVRPAGLAEIAFKWAKRKPTAAAAWGLGLTALVLLLFGGTVLWLLKRESDARKGETEATRQADEAREELADFERSRRKERALSAKNNLMDQLPDLRRRALWPQALSLLSQTQSLFESDADTAVTDDLKVAESEIRLLSKLDEIRMRKAALAAAQPEKLWNATDIRGAYQETFQEAGYDFFGNDEELVISALTHKIKASRVKNELIVALDDWAWSIKENYADVIWETTARVKGQKWRSNLRFTSLSGPEALRLSNEVSVMQLTPAIVCGLGLTMRLSTDKRLAIRWMEVGAKHYPSDFWVQFYLGTEYLRLQENESGAGAFRAAVAIRPDATLARKYLDQCLGEIEGRRLGR